MLRHLLLVGKQRSQVQFCLDILQADIAWELHVKHFSDKSSMLDEYKYIQHVYIEDMIYLGWNLKVIPVEAGFRTDCFKIWV